MSEHVHLDPVASCVVEIDMICEEHIDFSFEHDGCTDAGMYCEVCLIRRIAKLEEEVRTLKETSK